ncbi:terpene synthase family protein [Streptomyces iconiensis]|uniref:Terpene synthase n=1 Tax=Streptomyces iconiensis TaxID=1384038 RepID=A0ABT6ZS80_9ACTN|nr:hypothetical protein [Streptomyces iconiensis]MDJ1131918.1 hypothetical protein [Streptomyces iconiensis]
MKDASAAPAHERVVVPAFWCPLPAPSAQFSRPDELEAGALEWLRLRMLETEPTQLRRLEQADFGDLAALTMPYGHPEALLTATKLHATLFSLDDDVDEGTVAPEQMARQVERILALLDGSAEPRADDSARALALREIRIDLEGHATPPQVRRWVAGMERYLSAVVAETAFRRSERLPSLEEYLPVWMGAIGMAPSTALIPVVAGIEVSDGELDRPDVRALTEMTWALVALDNDLYSREKELHRAGDALNVVDVLAREHRTSLSRAQDEAVVLRDRVMALFLRLLEQVAADAGAPLRQYLEGLAQFVRGHLNWASECVRYAAAAAADVDDAADAKAGGNAAERTGRPPAAWWASRPTDDSLRPLPVASVRWWWEQLAV